MTFELKVDLTGMERHKRAFGSDMERALAGIAEDIVTDIKTSFDSGPGGRVYKRGRGRFHTASVAGQPPNVDDGTLRASIRQDKTGKLERTVSTGVEYALLLEEGTPKIAARPFMRPAFDRAARKFGANIKKRVK